VAPIRAAGGLLVAHGTVCLVHRPKYDDWSLPKGKLDPGESYEQAAVREVEEETGVFGRLLDELPAQQYLDGKRRPKIVRWWRMAVVRDPGFSPNDEVDELRWLPPAEAIELASYERDARLIEQALATP
jgi:8-oxo-dGTP diphosphatase